MAPTTGTGRKSSDGKEYDPCVFDHDDHIITNLEIGSFGSNGDSPARDKASDCLAESLLTGTCADKEVSSC